ncbi:MAG: flagellar biosynthetic protein FliO [Flavobacteriaceae bacterium]
MEFLDSLFGTELGVPARMIVAFVIVLVLIALTAWVIRKISGRAGGTGMKARQPRIGLVEVAAIDPKRRLVLVRRDSVEHLVLIGGPADVVVESGIRRDGVPASAPRAEPPRPEFTRMETPKAENAPEPRPMPVRAEMPPPPGAAPKPAPAGQPMRPLSSYAPKGKTAAAAATGAVAGVAADAARPAGTKYSGDVRPAPPKETREAPEPRVEPKVEPKADTKAEAKADAPAEPVEPRLTPPQPEKPAASTAEIDDMAAMLEEALKGPAPAEGGEAETGSDDDLYTALVKK